MNCSTPGFPVHHQLLELAQTHVHQVSDAIQRFHPLLSPSPPAFNLSQHQGLFQWVSSLHQMAKLLVSASASILPMNIQDWFPLGLTGLIFLQSKGLLRVCSKALTPLLCSAFSVVQISYPNMTTGKSISLTRRTFVGKVTSLLFKMLSRLFIALLPRNKHVLISWLQSPSVVILEPPKIKSVTLSIVSPSICHEVMGPDAMILVFWMLSFKPAFSLSSFTFIKRLFSSSSVSAMRVVSSAYVKLLIFLPATLISACASSSLAFLGPPWWLICQCRRHRFNPWFRKILWRKKQ